MNIMSQKLIEQVNNLPVKQSKSEVPGIESFIQVFESIAGEKPGYEVTISDEENSNNSALDGAPLAAANLTFWDFRPIQETDTSASSRQIPEFGNLPVIQQKIAVEAAAQCTPGQNDELFYYAAEGEKAEPGAVETLALRDAITIKNTTGVKPELLQKTLEPEHLGELVIKLANKKGDISAQFINGSVQAKEVWESTMVQLKEALARHQVNLQDSSAFVMEKSGQIPKFENLLMLQKIPTEGAVQYPQGQNNETIYTVVEGEIVEPGVAEKSALSEAITIKNTTGQSDMHQKESIPIRELPEKLVSILQSNSKSGEKPVLVQMKLEPEHLGELVIKLAYKKGEISAQFITGSVQAKEVLESTLVQLKEALAQHQVHLQESSVSVVYNGGQFMQQHGKPGGRKYLQLLNDSHKGEEIPLYEHVKPQPAGGVDYFI